MDGLSKLEGGSELSNIDLTEKDQVEFDERAATNVGIYDLQHELTKDKWKLIFVVWKQLQNINE